MTTIPMIEKLPVVPATQAAPVPSMKSLIPGTLEPLFEPGPFFSESKFGWSADAIVAARFRGTPAPAGIIAHCDVAIARTVPGTPDTYCIAIMLGHGDGTFASAVNVPLPNGPVNKLVAMDLRGNGFPDLVACTAAHVFVLLNAADGTGTFANPVAYDVPATVGTSTDLALGHFRGDGSLPLDIALLVNSGTAVWLLPGTGGGAFDAASAVVSQLPTSVMGYGWRMAAGHFGADADQSDDIVLLCQPSPSATQPGLQTYKAWLLASLSDGTFLKRPAALYESQGNTETASGVIAAAFRGAGQPVDVAVVASDYGPHVARVYLIQGAGAGTFAPQIGHDITGHCTNVGPHMEVADFDGDGYLDLAIQLEANDAIGDVQQVAIVTGLAGGVRPLDELLPLATRYDIAVNITSGNRLFAVGDFAGDGARPGIAWIDSTSCNRFDVLAILTNRECRAGTAAVTLTPALIVPPLQPAKRDPFGNVIVPERPVTLKPPGLRVVERAFTATATGFTNPVYQFWTKPFLRGEWSLVRDWSTADTVRLSRPLFPNFPLELAVLAKESSVSPGQGALCWTVEFF